MSEVPPPRRRRRWLRCLLLPLLGLLMLEAAGQLLIRIKPEWLSPPAHWSRADALSGQPWVDAYFKEWWDSYQVTWQSYTYWRRPPFDGEYIHVDGDGLRRTWTPPPPGADAPPAARVFMFGGSTLWGFGARDDYTIPSCLARALGDAQDRPVHVVNWGETGYVSTQGVLELLRRLHQGDIPDLAVFYDGVNDAFSSYQAGEAGLPQNEYRRRKEFNLLGDNSGKTGFLVGAAGYRLLKRSAIVRWTESLARRVSPPLLPGSFAPTPSDEDAARLAAETAAVYLANVRILEALADQFGFQVLCFWQPALYNKPIRTEYESEQAEAFAYFENLYLQATEAVRAGQDASPHDSLLMLTEVFQDVEEPVFLDFCHVSEAGNARLAEAMVQPVIERLQPPRLSPP